MIASIKEYHCPVCESRLKPVYLFGSGKKVTTYKCAKCIKEMGWTS